MSLVGEGTPDPSSEAGNLEEFLDTNVVVRYLVNDDVNLASRASTLIESDRRLTLSVVTLAEIGFVLMHVYHIDRATAVDTLIDLLNRENIVVREAPTDIAIQALRFCRPSGRVNFGDAMLWAVVRASAPARVWTFDRRFPSDGLDRRDP